MGLHRLEVALGILVLPQKFIDYVVVLIKLNEDLLQVSLSAFAFLFSELVQYNQTQVDNIGELERRWQLINVSVIRHCVISMRFKYEWNKLIEKCYRAWYIYLGDWTSNFKFNVVRESLHFLKWGKKIFQLGHLGIAE